MTAPDTLSADLADLLDNTFGSHGLAGVLADWLDERSEFWGPFAVLLRISQPAPDGHRGFNIGFRFRPAAPGVVFWVTSINHNSKWFGAPPDGDVLLGAYRTVHGREAMWSRMVPKSAVSDVDRTRVWNLFPQPAAPTVAG